MSELRESKYTPIAVEGQVQPERRRFGSKRKVGEGVWQVRYPTVLPSGKAGPRKAETVFGSEFDADARLDELEQEHMAKTAIRSRIRHMAAAGNRSRNPLTVDDVWFGFYIPYAERRIAEGRMSPVTFDGYVSNYALHIRPAFGEVLTEEVRFSQMQ